MASHPRCFRILIRHRDPPQMDEMDSRITRLDKALTEQKGVQGILAQQTKDSHKRILEMGEQLHELNTELMGTPSDDEE